MAASLVTLSKAFGYSYNVTAGIVGLRVREHKGGSGCAGHRHSIQKPLIRQR
jgi:hypothetical protein